jgi:glycosyltransferase involved in cell wall biosynthesis
MKISVCIITRDEEENLPRCLQSCAALADEIVVLDSGSSDRTVEIAKQFGASCHFQEWLGYVGQKNKLLALAANEWVLSLDADEELSSALQDELRQLKSREPDSDVGGFSMPRCVLYEGRWIRHGDWYPDRLTRLFRRTRARFAGGKVHERLEVSGRITALDGDLHHYSFRNGADHLDRARQYARLWAETQLESGRRAGRLEPYWHAVFRWLRGYLLRRGFLDGPQGWRIAKLNAQEVFWKYQLLRDLQNPP